MSSSNSERIVLIKETVQGQTPVAGNFKTVRFTSDSLSGSPDTAESATIRTDRLSSGQVVTGLTLSGDINFELAKDDALDILLESAMHSTWVVDTPVTVDLTIDASLKTIVRASGDWNTDVVVGDFINLTGFVDATNNTQVIVKSIDAADTISYVGETLVNETGSGTTFNVLDKLSIGTTQISMSVEKSFSDLTTKAINYRGELVSNLNLSIAYGSIASGSVTLVGTDYEPVDAAADFMTNGRTIDAADTTNFMNGSIDMPFIASSVAGTFTNNTFCIQKVDLALNNNQNPRNCIGEVAPVGYNSGTAQIGVNISTYLADANWTLLASKLSQTPFALGFMVKNGGGHYGFYMPAVQVSFDDPGAGGANQDIMLDMSGTAKVGNNGESSLVIYRS